MNRIPTSIKSAVVLIAFSFLYTGCNTYCFGTKISVEIGILFPGDSVSIYADNTLIATKSVKEIVSVAIRDKRNKVAEICATKDSILINIFYSSMDTSQHIPSRDTSFYIHPKEIRGFSIAVDKIHEIAVFFDKVNGGYGIYEPNSR
ncbi:hypothetical protein [Chitinophaga arvensicola]|uniref:Uncharacterized protein n=1 Tax=Chitinophaga arvensicola TaxID=29529 RepID=A0A1I0S795_9BACT|nr:hypothetical protein [Chitinophaga arvensicola]SEW51617.1 hypothetical protein SAMN04488122_4378 [Chitinophaga arvensicola]